MSYNSPDQNIWIIRVLRISSAICDETDHAVRIHELVYGVSIWIFYVCRNIAPGQLLFHDPWHPIFWSFFSGPPRCTIVQGHVAHKHRTVHRKLPSNFYLTLPSDTWPQKWNNASRVSVIWSRECPVSPNGLWLLLSGCHKLSDWRINTEIPSGWKTLARKAHRRLLSMSKIIRGICFLVHFSFLFVFCVHDSCVWVRLKCQHSSQDYSLS